MIELLAEHDFSLQPNNTMEFDFRCFLNYKRTPVMILCYEQLPSKILGLSHKNVASYSSSNINLALSSSRETKGHSSIFMLPSSLVSINWCPGHSYPVTFNYLHPV
jgi:hypothetical protein